jgi:uncharacterized protein (TIGR00645 family)
MLHPITRYMANFLFFSRWLIAPFLLGLFCCVVLVIVKFAIELFALMKEVANNSWHDLVVGILTLIDLTLIANLILVIIFSAHENYFRRLGGGQRQQPSDGLERVDFGNLKQKLLGSIAAIAAVDALAWFLDLEKYADTSKLAWALAFPLMFVAAMVLLGLADWLNRLGTKEMAD